MTKKISLKNLFFGLIFTSLCFPQAEPKDSIMTEDSSLPPMENIILNLERFELYRELNSFNPDLPASYDSNTIWLWTSCALSRSDFENPGYGEIPSNVSRFLYKNYIEESKFNPVKYALGLAQAGAVGYLAYVHIKKYGFLQ